MLAGIIGLGMALRLTSLLALPIFNDEAIYGRWAQVILERGEWLVPLSDGKMPLYYWVATLAGMLTHDPLFGLRLTSALAGVVGIIGVYLVGAELFGFQVGLVSSGLYAVIPFAVVNDRLGLPDGTLAAMAPFILLAAYRAAKNPSGRRLVWLSALLSAALLIKTTALFLFPAAAVGFLIGRKECSPEREADKRLGVRRPAAALVAAFGVPALLLGFARGAGVVFGKTAAFLIRPQDLMGLPFAIWWTNLERLVQWSLHYLLWPSLVLAGGFVLLGFFGEGGFRGVRRARRGIFWLTGADPSQPGGPSDSGRNYIGRDRSRDQSAYYLLALTFFISSGLALVASAWFSRYLALVVPFFILAVGWGIFAAADAVPRRSRALMIAGLMAAVAIPAVLQDVRLIRAPDTFSWAADDRWQYIDGWPSGYGLNELVSFIDDRAADRSAGRAALVVACDPDLGFPGAGLELRFGSRQDVKIEYFPVKKRLPVLEGAGQHPYVYVLDEPRQGSVDDFLRLNPGWTTAAVFHKPGRLSAFRVLERKTKKH